MRASRLACLSALLAVTLLAAGCAEKAGGADGDELGRQICTEADLGGSYVEKTSGTISVQNLADLADDASARKKQLKGAGMQGGRFAYWVHTVPNPPFDPPLEVVCQALAFRSPEQAAAFVRELKPTPDDLASTAMVWLADKHRAVTEIGLSQSGSGAAPRRTFKITARGSEVDFTIYAQVQAAGRYVRTVYAGKEHGGPEVTLNDAGSIAAAIQHRVGE